MRVSIVGSLLAEFCTDPNGEIRFWITEQHIMNLSGTLDPIAPGGHCGGRVRVRSWRRGEWEAALGAKVDVFDPRTGDVLPKKLIKWIRSGLASWPVLSRDSKVALHAVAAILGDPFDEMLMNSIERKKAADEQVDTLMICVNGPNLGFAVAFILALNAGRPTQVRRAWEIAMTKAGAGRGAKLALDIAGSRKALQSVLNYMDAEAPTEKEAEVARFIVEASVSDVVRLDSVQMGMIVDRLALTLKQLGVTEVALPN
ncbi:MAG: hypothetical protein ABL889_00180 [Terricaulis sp.]